MAKFINPYNFIPFGGDKTAPKNKKTDYYENKGELKSGWLDVSIHMKTPFIVPNGAYPKYIDPVTGKEVKNPSEQERKKLHKKYDFMRDPNGVPFVPGSEIRGMVRSVYEAATDSCVPVLLNDKPISHRVPTFSAIQKRGLLQHKDNRWILYSAIASKEEVTFNRDGKMVNDNNVIIADKPGFSPDNGKNFLQYNIPVVKNKPYHIAYLRTKDIVFSWNSGDNYAYDKLKSELQRDGAVGSNNPNKESHKALLDALEKAVRDEKQMVPVYYFTVRRQINGQETKLVYMSGSSIGRIAQYRKWEDIIGEHKPCVGPKLCPACMLFGTIKGDGLKSHLALRMPTWINQMRSKVYIIPCKYWEGQEILHLNFTLESLLKMQITGMLTFIRYPARSKQRLESLLHKTSFMTFPKRLRGEGRCTGIQNLPVMLQ